MIQVDYDWHANAVLINLKEVGQGGAVFTYPADTIEKWGCMIVLDFDRDWRVVCVDVMDANYFLPIKLSPAVMTGEPRCVLLNDFVHVDYSPALNTAYLGFWGPESARMRTSRFRCPKKKVPTTIFIDFGEPHRLLGIEVHEADKFLPPEVLEMARKEHGEG